MTDGSIAYVVDQLNTCAGMFLESSVAMFRNIFGLQC